MKVILLKVLFLTLSVGLVGLLTLQACERPPAPKPTKIEATAQPDMTPAPSLQKALEAERFMGASKSGPVFLPPPQAQQQQPAPAAQKAPAK